MVVILQQSSDNGRRFVSTVVEETGSFSSNFSLGSQNSISERSAIYKQRIDSLFGRRARLNRFRPNAEPFCVRVGGSSPGGSGGTNAMGLPIPPPPKFTDNQGQGHTSDDEDYEKITEDKGTSCVIPDSLNIFKDRKMVKPISGGNHVSSVKLNCEDNDSPHHTTAVYSLNDEGPSSGSTSTGDSGAHMWRNGVYNGGPGLGDDGQHQGASPGGVLKFPVEYLGSVPVEGSTTALQDLQIPLRALYLNFLSGKNIMRGQLAITADGLRFEAPRLRLVNPFTTIAVWAAIKFVARGEPDPNECAFMPLISDPEGQDRDRLFSTMDSELAETYLDCLKESSSEEHCFRNPPIFACVMREASFSLDCHAFACRCAEDAIVVAANLYQSLVDKMRAVHKEAESGYGSLTRNSPATHTSSSPISNQKGACSSDSSATSPGHGALSGSCCSSTGDVSSSPGKRESAQQHRVIFSDSEAIPVRPPRRKKKHTEGSSSDPNLKRYNSEDSVLLKMPTRRKSFKGNYNHHRPHYVKHKKRVQIATPEETSSADSVNESVDQVLDRIINPGGMSFNDLKPSYQELILKIALTLTQDQLYQKSKQAMKKQQPMPLRKKLSSKQNGAEGQEETSQFLGNLFKPFSKMASGKVSNSPSKGLRKLGASPLNGNAKQKVPKVILKKPREEDPFMSFCSGCVCDNCSDKCYCSLPSKHNVKIVGLPPGVPSTVASTCPSEGTTTCKASTTNAEGKKVCGYDTDSCAESEKCYCSLQGVKSNGLKVYNINLDTETSDTDTNSYDLEPFNHHNHTQETSTSSNLKTVSTRSVEILSYHPSKKLAYSVATPSPAHIQTNALVHFEEEPAEQPLVERTRASTKVLGSTKFRNHLAENPSAAPHSNSESADKHISRNSPSERQRNKVLLITGASSPASQVIYKDHPYSFHTRLSDFGGDMVVSKNMNGKLQRSLGDITEDEDTLEEDGNEQDTKDEDSEDALEPEKVLQMKKTAEIAAMFNNMRLGNASCSKPNYNAHLYPKKPEKIQEKIEDSIDFEASLGYLP